MARKSFPAEPLERIGLRDLCEVCGVPAELVIDLVEEGILEPLGEDRRGLYFTAVAVRRVGVVQRLQRDLGVNRAGAALALELIDELRELRARVRVLEAQIEDYR